MRAGGEQSHVGHREVEPLGAGRRHDVRRVFGQEESAVPHRRLHEGAHLQHAPVGDRPGLEGPAVLPVTEAGGKRRPDPVVRPVGQVGVVGHLEVEPRHGRGTHRVHREAIRMPGVDELVGGRRDVGEDAEPQVGIDLLPGLAHRLGDRGARQAEGTVAADHHVRVDPLLDSGRVGEGHRRTVGLEVVQRGVRDLRVDLLAMSVGRGDQVLLHLGLPVDPHRAADQVDEVEVVPLALPLIGPLQVDAVVLVALAVEPLAEPGRAQQVDSRLLEDAGADPRSDVLLRARLTTIDSTPSAASRGDSSRPAGPAPTIATSVCMTSVC
jgi:hypothetical protein